MCATGICETSKTLKNWTIFVCGKRNLCSSPFSTPPPCCLMVSCLQNRAADNVCGTSAQNRTLHTRQGCRRERNTLCATNQIGRCPCWVLNDSPLWPRCLQRSRLTQKLCCYGKNCLICFLQEESVHSLQAAIFHVASDRRAPAMSSGLILQTQCRL